MADLAGDGPLEADDRARQRRLPAARLADEREHLALGQREVDAVDGAGDRPVAVAELHVQVAELEQRRAHAGFTSMQAARRPGPAGQSSTSSDGHSARTTGQRGWKVQPDGSSRGSGGSPGRPDGLRRKAGSPITGNAAASARVYGCFGWAKISSAGALLDDPPRVHDREPPAGGHERREVVGDEQRGEPEPLLEVVEQPQDLRLDHHVERGRRLVGDEQLRVAGERERDQHALALAARELVRVVARAPRRQADQLEQLADADRGLALRGRRVQLDRLADLAADPLHGVERVQRALEDDRHARPAHGAQPPGLHRQHVLALEQHLAGDLRAPGQEPQERAGERGLAAARLAREPERVARREVERDAAHRREPPRLGRVGHVQVAHGQQRLGGDGRAHSSTSFRRGSRISSSAWPMSVKESTTRRMPSPGGM